MNILEKLPFLNKTDDLQDLVDEADEAKKERIAFHRAKVRNGPVSFKEPTTGQRRRERERMVKGMQRKTRRRQVQLYFLTERENSILRGKLQAAGLAPYVFRSEPDRIEQVASVVWLVQRFGEVDPETGRIDFSETSVRKSLQSALNRWESINGEPASQIDPEYVTPVYTVDAA